MKKIAVVNRSHYQRRVFRSCADVLYKIVKTIKLSVVGSYFLI